MKSVVHSSNIIVFTLMNSFLNRYFFAKLLIYLVGSHVISGKMYSEAVVAANTTPSG